MYNYLKYIAFSVLIIFIELVLNYRLWLGKSQWLCVQLVLFVSKISSVYRLSSVWHGLMSRRYALFVYFDMVFNLLFGNWFDQFLEVNENLEWDLPWDVSVGVCIFILIRIFAFCNWETFYQRVFRRIFSGVILELFDNSILKPIKIGNLRSILHLRACKARSLLVIKEHLLIFCIILFF